MNKYFDIAKGLRAPLRHADQQPVSMVTPVRDAQVFQGWAMKPDDRVLSACAWHGGDVFYLDFGRHMTGYLRYALTLVGTKQDAPAKLRFTFGERPCELMDSAADYHGWVSSSWLQEELKFYDWLPVSETLPRRYAFRYLKVEVLATSQRFGVRFEQLSCDAVTSADEAKLTVPEMGDKWRDIFNVAAATMRDCMQHVFEDGPKRDRRLWMGDLHLQALTNYHTYHNDDLVKRCLYLFAACRDEQGHIMAALYDVDRPLHDDTYLLDYALLFASALLFYYQHTGDKDTAQDLLEIAVDQVRLADSMRDENGCVRYGEGFTCFIDWNDALDKHAAAQGVFIYCARHALKLCEALGEAQHIQYLQGVIDSAASAALAQFWDAAQKRFVCGPDRQVSWASQVWLVLAGVLEKEVAQAVLLDCFENPPSIEMITPYMVHYQVEALFAVGADAMATERLYSYWQGMVARGADCFWEIWLPKDPEVSPYGGAMIHSYCHAWSCTPAYFISKYALR